ncbi:MAG: EAL domain-containing protein [Rhodobacteraceae bacterium]|nr:EAL domain-containing protein [Paracoccaceae bacterium]
MRFRSTRFNRFGDVLPLLGLLAALAFGTLWFGAEGLLFGMLVIVLARPRFAAPPSGRIAPVSGPATRAEAVAALQHALDRQEETGLKTACLALQIEEFDKLQRDYGDEAAERLLSVAADRIAGALRKTELIARLKGPRFAIVPDPVAWLDLETLIQMATRLQKVLAEPVSLDGGRVFLTASVGFCTQARAPDASGNVLLDAAEAALAEARANGAGSIRAFGADTKPSRRRKTTPAAQLVAALEQGEIRPWFQPQLDTDTGQVSGFEALARWQRADGTMTPPDEFLPALAQAGLADRLGEVILYHSLQALRSWDRSRHPVPRIGVNFAAPELTNPKLPDKVRWDLDRFDIAPDRLAIEIHESVLAQSTEDSITRTILSLAEMGCYMDLDDFGTGNASIAHIRRFRVNRIKIDMSFIRNVDTDRAQQQILSGILSLAERMELDTLAEGVETVGEHAMLAQMGCGHVQGFAIARPMPFEETGGWLEAHAEKLKQASVVKGGPLQH